jgi:hypothetical protein
VTWTWAEPPYQPWRAVVVSSDGSDIVALGLGTIYRLGAPAPASLLPPPPPRILVGPSANGLKISWLVPSTKFFLQQTSDLSTANWTTVPVAPVLNSTNLHYEVAVSSAPVSRFYRLKSQ